MSSKLLFFAVVVAILHPGKPEGNKTDDSPPEPGAEALPKPDEGPGPKPDAEAVPKPGAEGEPKPDVEPALKPDAEALPKPGAEAVPKPGAEAVPKPGAEAEPKPGGEPAPKPGAEAVPKPGAEALPKPGEEPAPKPGAEALPKPGEGPAPKPGAEVPPKPGEEPAPKPSEQQQTPGPDDECLCEDKYPESCAEFFGNGTGCNTDAALKCAKTCKRCCELKEFNCPNKQGKLDCALIGKGGLCKTTDRMLKRKIRKQCPRTCGFCIPNCRDKNAEMCSLLKEKCSETAIKEICKRTCRVCIPDDCVDLVPTCSAMKNQCTEPNMKEIMHAACNETCGLCQQTEPCEDLSPKYVLVIMLYCRAALTMLLRQAKIYICVLLRQAKNKIYGKQKKIVCVFRSE